jgi:hypothetical protein
MLRRLDSLWPYALLLAVPVFLVLGQIEPGAEIIDLELAATPGRAAHTMARWDLGSARLQTWGDYVFIVLLGLGMTGALRWSLGPASRLVWLAPVAAACDVLENIGILVMLSNPASPGGFAAPATATMATLKFAALAVAITAVIIGAFGRSRRART